MKKIYYDFETTSPNPLEAEILEACFLFVEDREIIDRFESKIIINKPYAAMCILERETLEFNGIKNKEDLLDHNQQARHWDEFIDKVMKYYIEMFIDYDKNKPIKIPLSGWNNSGFDNIIFQRKLGVIKGQLIFYKDWFDYHTRDIMHRFLILKEIGMLKGLALGKVHKEIFPETFLQYHRATSDCFAVKDLDEWFEDHIMMEIKR